MSANRKTAMESKDLFFFERKFWRSGLNFVVGIDEAGRGAIAGPIVAAAVCLSRSFNADGIDDSKTLKEKSRNKAASRIAAESIAFSWAALSARTVDEIGISSANKMVMLEAVKRIGISPDAIIVDYFSLEGLSCEQLSLVKGDSKSVSVASASIIAKVTRDRIMNAFDKIHPHFGFAKHKGYGTAFHLNAIERFGPSPEHRFSFSVVSQNSFKI